MKKSKAKSLNNILDPVKSNRDNVCQKSQGGSLKSKSKRNRKNSDNFNKGSDTNDHGSSSHKRPTAINHTICDYPLSSPSDSESMDNHQQHHPRHHHRRQKSEHTPVSKSFSLVDVLSRRRFPSMRKSNSMKCVSQKAVRPSSLSLKTTTKPNKAQPHENADEGNKHINSKNSYSCDNILISADNALSGNKCESHPPCHLNMGFTTLEIGPIVHLPSSQSVTDNKSLNKTNDKDNNNNNNNGNIKNQFVLHDDVNMSPPPTRDVNSNLSCPPAHHDHQRPSNQTKGMQSHTLSKTNPNHHKNLRQKRKTLKVSKSLDIDLQEDPAIPTVTSDIDFTDKQIVETRTNQNLLLKQSNVVSANDSFEIESYPSKPPPHKSKTKMIVSQSCDDILTLDKKPNNIMVSHSNVPKDYLKVPQRNHSVDYSLLDSDFKPNTAKRQRFRTRSNTYKLEDEWGACQSERSDSNSCSSIADAFGENSPTSKTVSKEIRRSETYQEKQNHIRSCSFAISPNETTSSSPPNPFTFDMTSRETKPKSPETTRNSKQHLHVSKSFDFGTTSSLASSPPRHNHHFNRKCLSTESKSTNPDSKQAASKPPRSPVSYPRLLSEAASPSCDTCSPPSNRIFNRLARRFSLRRKSSKEKKRQGSVDDLLKYSLGIGDISRRSLESDVSVGSQTGNTTDSDLSSLHDIEHESLYRGVIGCLLHPLGSTGTEIGLRPGDLLDHVRLVYDVPHPDHAFYIREELQNVPTKVQASVTLLEAKDLTWTEDHGGVYCLLTLVQPTTTSTKTTTTTINNTKWSPRNSPRGSPKTSPRSSPKFVKSPQRSPSLDCDPLRSHTCPNTHDPKWNECFYIDLENPSSDEITIFVCYYDINTPCMDTAKQPEKGNTLKTFFRNILQAGNDHEKTIPGCFGRVVLPVKDIPVEGCDRWFQILPIGSWNKHKPIGQLRLQVAVSGKRSTMNNYFCAEDYHQTSLLEHKYGAAEIMDAEGLDLTLSPQAQKVLNIFAVANGISKLSQKIMNLTVFLELVFSRYSHTVTDSVLHRAMEDVQMTWCEMQVRGGGDFLQKMPLCDAEICLYRAATRRYVEAIIYRLDAMPVLFPPCMDTIHSLKAHFGIGLHLLELDVWDAITSPQRDLASAIVNKLQRDVRIWMDANLDTIHQQHGQVKDTVIPEVEVLVHVTNTLISILTPLGVVEQFFLGLDVKYYRIVYFETERKLSLKVRELMMSLDKYQTRYHHYQVNLNRSCRLSIKLFLAVRTYYHTIRDVFNERDLFRLSIPAYQDWFQEAVVFWLQMFRTECTSRIQKALEIDKDLVLVTSQLKYSNSSVDAQACFSEITHEWRQIDIKDADTAVMGVTKIVDMICDGARVYASRIQTILERNCYYDSNQTQFDVTDRMCITLNNIQHVRRYLSELPELLEIEDASRKMGQKHEDEQIGRKSLDTLNRLIQNADADILLMSGGILRKVCQRLSVEVKNSMDKFLIKTPELSTATDKVIGYLNTNLETLKLRLSETIFPHMASQLWMMVAQLFDEHVLVGKPPDYYEHMQQHLRALTLFFSGWFPGHCDPFFSLNTPLLEGLRERLEISSWKTDRLMREYLHTLSTHMCTPLEYLGHLAVKTAYMEETRGNITVYVKVIQGIDLPGLDSTGLSDPYVIVSVQPQEIFGQPEQRTRTIGQTLQPVFNTTFMFPNIPKECLAETGNSLLLSVMDQDVVTCDDFAGEVVISLDSLMPITMNESVDISPALLMPLKRPRVETDGPFQVLRERSSWDKSAKKFIKSRMRYIENQPELKANNVKERLSNLFKFWNNNNKPSSSSSLSSLASPDNSVT